MPWTNVRCHGPLVALQISLMRTDARKEHRTSINRMDDSRAKNNWIGQQHRSPTHCAVNPIATAVVDNQTVMDRTMPDFSSWKTYVSLLVFIVTWILIALPPRRYFGLIPAISRTSATLMGALLMVMLFFIVSQCIQMMSVIISVLHSSSLWSFEICRMKALSWSKSSVISIVFYLHIHSSLFTFIFYHVHLQFIISAWIIQF